MYYMLIINELYSYIWYIKRLASDKTYTKELLDTFSLQSNKLV